MNKLEFIRDDLKKLSNEDLLKYYDNPRNIFIKDCRNEHWENGDKSFPSHCMVFLTHGSYAVNEKIRRTTDLTKTQFLRLIRNFSDFGTRKMIKKSGIPEENVICFPGSRSIGDPNREYQDEKQDSKLDISKRFIRNTDFNGQKIINNPEQFRNIGKKKVENYHNNLDKSLYTCEVENGGSIGVDVHDTGINLMNIKSNLDKFREKGFPEITLGTLDSESCNIEILEFFAEKLKKYLGVNIHINTPYKGGYVTQKHGKQHREKINNGDSTKKSIRNMIQVELGRYLYMKESTQEVDWERMNIIGEGIKRAITDTGIHFNEQYFRNLNK